MQRYTFSSKRISLENIQEANEAREVRKLRRVLVDNKKKLRARLEGPDELRTSVNGT